MIYSLLIMSLLLAGALTYALITVNNVSQSKNADQALAAYYAAESGVEDAMLAIKKGGATLPSLRVDKATPKVLNESEGNGSAWYRDVTDSVSDYMITLLPKEANVPLDLYYPNDVTRATNIRCLWVTWRSNNQAVLRVAWLAWKASGGLPVDGANSAVQSLSGMFDINSASVQLLRDPYSPGITWPDATAFRVRLTALFGDAFDITVRAKQTDGCTEASADASIPGHFMIDATGVYGKNKQRARFIIPQSPVAASLWDHAIFSGGDLLK